VSVLLIDIGNTRIKWQRKENSALVSEGSVDKDKAPHYAWPDQVKEVIVSSVSTNAELHSLFDLRYGERLRWLAQPVSDHPGFRHCYAEPARLGVDRWLAMLGARCLFSGKLLVVDAGTALTLDLLDEDNHHRGGYIVPGLTMAREALFGGTDRVRPFKDETQVSDLGVGQNTVACVASGTLRQHTALIEALMTDYPDYQLVITGGDGKALAELLQSRYYPNLIFDGMELLCAG